MKNSRVRIKPRPKSTFDSRPLYMRAEEALAKWIDTMSAGDRLPTEPELAKRLGISRATLREAMRLFEERGRLKRRPGVGTFVLPPHPVIDSGLEVLESIDTLAHRLNLQTRMADLSVNTRPADPSDAAGLGITEGTPVVAISRTILVGEVPAAYLTDVVLTGIVSQDELETFSGSVLDLLIRRGDPALGLSRTALNSVSADSTLARHLGVQRGTPLMHFEAVLYTQEGKAIDHSHSHFVPGYFTFHVVRKVGR
ncbi:MAG TPA: GntR family transcriptional regulator [Anaerolineales bacterium]|nr:GntR family transcriptional regulator [Anaerolineales bacterium]